MRNACILLFLALVIFATPAFAQSKELITKYSVPDINGRAIELVKPAFPETAVATGADGLTLVLRVMVDEAGHVISAQCVRSCDPMLREAATAAATSSKFKPLEVNGVAVQYEGDLMYTFVVDRINWAEFGAALESTRQFDNLSLAPAAQMLSSSYAVEKAKLIALDSDDISFEARQNGIRDVEGSIKRKLTGVDLWRFETSMALRRVTFWTQAGEKTDRKQLQQAVNDLGRVISAAPDNISASLIGQLKIVSELRVSAEMSESELRRKIASMTDRIRL